MSLNDDQLKRYARQLLLPQIDLAGQEQLAERRVLIVGAGGLGCPTAQYLAGAGVGSLRLVDPDVIELSNLHRQLAFTERDIGEGKAATLASRIKAGNREVEVEAVTGLFDADSAADLLRGVDLVVDASDSIQARRDMDRETRGRGLAWIMGASVRTSGQWVAFQPGRQTGCYHCLMSGDAVAGLGSCEQLGVLGPAVGLIALQQSTLALRYLLGHAMPWGRVHYYDIWDRTQRELQLEPSPACALCHPREEEGAKNGSA